MSGALGPHRRRAATLVSAVAILLVVAAFAGLFLSVHATHVSTAEAEINRLSQRVPSGEMRGCVSPYGVRDMGGNVDEWAVNVTLFGKPQCVAKADRAACGR